MERQSEAVNSDDFFDLCSDEELSSKGRTWQDKAQAKKQAKSFKSDTMERQSEAVNSDDSFDLCSDEELSSKELIQQDEAQAERRAKSFRSDTIEKQSKAVNSDNSFDWSSDEELFSKEHSCNMNKPKTSTVDPELRHSPSETIAEQITSCPREYIRELSKSDIVVKQSVPFTIDNSKSKKLLSHGIKEEKMFTLTPEPEPEHVLLEAINQSSKGINFDRKFSKPLNHITEEQPNPLRKIATHGLLPMEQKELFLRNMFEQFLTSLRDLAEEVLSYVSCLEAAANSPVKILSDVTTPEPSTTKSSTSE
ncbi:uncharacterized protein [Anoplolepis gracilipes]|uniref:uncharacterized protein n=1 Tax=Anoplolepis gracilipes TaxID=354296 RepID=UPI003B9E816E